MNRTTYINDVRGTLRLINVNPFSDSDILREIENAIDDFSNRCPFAVAVDRAHGVKSQRELILPFDVLEVIEVHYMDTAGTTLTNTISSSSPPTTNDYLTVGDTTDFATSGSVIIDDEELSYTSKSSTTLIGITRGANTTVAAAHSAGAGVIQSGASFAALEPSTTRNMIDTDSGWLSAEAAAPETYYTYPGVLGFNSAPDKNGYFNIVLRNLIRPPSLTGDDSIVEGLLVSFNKAIVSYASAKLATILGQDETSLVQAKQWLSDYYNDISMFKKRDLMYLRNQRPAFVPYRGRPTGFVA